MNIFINNITLKIYSTEKNINPAENNVHQLIDFSSENKETITSETIKFETIKFDSFKRVVFLLNMPFAEIKNLIVWLETAKNTGIDKIFISINDKTTFRKFFKNSFKIISAAGGVVLHQEKILLMYRRKSWDLPKGKIDARETPQKAAIREIKEETNIDAKIIGKIGKTYHNYRQNGEFLLKKTYWYVLQAQGKINPKPQTEEDIEKLIFADNAQMIECSKKMYQSIRFVLEKYNS